MNCKECQNARHAAVQIGDRKNAQRRVHRRAPRIVEANGIASAQLLDDSFLNGKYYFVHLLVSSQRVAQRAGLG